MLIKDKQIWAKEGVTLSQFLSLSLHLPLQQYTENNKKTEKVNNSNYFYQCFKDFRETLVSVTGKGFKQLVSDIMTLSTMVGHI